MKTLAISLMTLLFASCGAINFNPAIDLDTGCILQKVELKDPRFVGETGFLGYCPNTNAFIARWKSETPDGNVWYQIVAGKDQKVVVSYRAPNGSWVIWSEKGGLEVKIPKDLEAKTLANASRAVVAPE